MDKAIPKKEVNKIERYRWLYSVSLLGVNIFLCPWPKQTGHYFLPFSTHIFQSFLTPITRNKIFVHNAMVSEIGATTVQSLI